MFNLPRTQKQWVVAIVSALTGFFFGGAAIAAVQTFMKKHFGLR